MDEYGTITIETELNRVSYGTSRLVRVAHADPRVRIGSDVIDDLRNGNPEQVIDGNDPHFHLNGDVLTIRDDYGQRFIYRIHWDDYADGGYLAEWPD